MPLVGGSVRSQMSGRCLHESQLAKLSAPSTFTKIYKDECTYCFTTPDDENGLDICLTCFNGACLAEKPISIGSHSQLHFSKTGHAVVLNVERRIDTETEQPMKLQKVEINPNDDDKQYVFVYSISCVSCGIQVEWQPEGDNAAAINDLSLNSSAQQTIQAIIKASSARNQSEVQAWQEEVIACEHTRGIHQEVHIDPRLRSLSSCSDCPLKDNLWLCLTCGNVGCGRRQYDGSGGNGHGASHFETHGHPVAVKLGTITAEGTADVHCYICQEMRIDPNLKSHLSALGIDLGGVEKTEKTMAELQLEQNLKFDFSMVTDDGKELAPLSGPGHVGLKNLGNSCYLNSTVQSIFHLMPFVDAYGQASCVQHHIDCSKDPATCFVCQAVKLQLTFTEGSPDKVAPWMFKNVVTSGHAEFSGSRQQDASEFLAYLLKVIKRSDPTNASSLVDPFTFSLQQSLICSLCGDSRVQTTKATMLSPQIGQVLANADDDVKLGEKISLKNSLATFFGEEVVEATCSKCKGSSKKKMTSLVSTPRFLIVSVGRYVLKNWVPSKLEIPIDVPFDDLDLSEFVTTPVTPHNNVADESPKEQLPYDELTLAELVSMGFPMAKSKRAIQETGNKGMEAAINWIMEHEDLIVSDESSPATGGVTSVPSDMIQLLVDAGFSADSAKEALQATDLHVERAFDWLLSRPEPTPTGMATDSINTEPPVTKYHLKAFISHKGPSMHCGHYVAHVLDEVSGQWALFNDDRVVKADPQPPKAASESAYIYIYERT